MRARAAALALLATVGLVGFVQARQAWQIEDPDKWLDLIAKYTPTIQDNAACLGYLNYAANAVAEAAGQGRLWWDKRLPADVRGQVDWNRTTLKPEHMRVNPDHWQLVDSDYETSKTLAHEGLHWWHGRPPVIEGKVLTSDEAETWVEKKIEECFLPEDDEEDDPDPGGGNTGTTETCTETLKWVPPETKPVFVKPESSTTEQGQPLPGPSGVTPTYRLPPVLVGGDSKGEWVEVVVEKGYWKKECTLN